LTSYFRDIKASNLLLSHNGILKVGDFGLAREYGSPLKAYTSIVVTLWYRAPELLLGIKEYSTFIDVWSVGCIFGELLQMKPLFTGKSDPDQLSLIYKLLGEFLNVGGKANFTYTTTSFQPSM
jgi:cell division cycle 2-like protein